VRSLARWGVRRVWVVLIVSLLTGLIDMSAASATSASEVYRWGDYNAGTSEGRPAPVGTLSSVVAVNASNSSSYVLQCVGGHSACPSDGTVWAFGENTNGQLGNGTTTGSLKTPVQVEFPSGVHIVSIGEAYNSGFAVDSTGQGWAWGANAGALCVGDRAHQHSQKTPARVIGLGNATQVQGGSGHVLWLLSNGNVKECANSTATPTVPALVARLSNIVQISAGNIFSGALDSSGRVYMWGYNNLGQIGIGSTARYISRPTQVHLPAPAVEISAGGDHFFNGHTLVLLATHQVYAWGNGRKWQLGDGSNTNQPSPVRVDVPTGVTFVSVAAGGQQSFGIDTTGRVWHWGNGSRRFLLVDSGANLISATAGDVLDHH